MSKHKLVSAVTFLTMLMIGSLIATKRAVSMEENGNKPVVVRGLVRDAACPLQNKEATSRVFNRKCLVDCVRLGSPLAILTDDGSVYLIVSGAIPDVDQHEKLKPFVGKYVEASGIVYDRKGSRAIDIKTIKEDQTVKLTEVSE